MQESAAAAAPAAVALSLHRGLSTKTSRGTDWYSSLLLASECIDEMLSVNNTMYGSLSALAGSVTT
jgi:hypothetical protein